MSIKPVFVFLFVLAIASLPIATQKVARAEVSTPQVFPKVEAEVRDAIHQRLAAVRREDAKAYGGFFAEDCLLTSDSGARVKAEDIARDWSRDNHSGISYHGSEALDLTIHVYAETAIASYRLELDEDWAGQRLSGASRVTDVFAHRNGRWLIIAHQETPIPNLRRVAVQVDPDVFDAYAGEYEFMPEYVVKVKRQGDKLMDLWPGDADYVEDVPIDQNTFVARGEPGEMIYVKDANGKVTHFILRTVGGDLIAKKTK
jgi:ketosteroid isomerase-like protein